jgi:hypothetical protein
MEYAGDDVKRIIAYEACVMLANLGVSTYAASEAFSSFVNKLHPDLRKALNKEYGNDFGKQAARVVSMAVISLLTALPYGFAALTPLALRVIIVATNSINNYFATNNIMWDHAKYLLHKASASQEEIAYQKLMAAFEHTMKSITYNIVGSGKKLPPELSRQTNLNGQQLLEYFADLSREQEVDYYRPMSSTQFLFRRLIPGGIGAGFASGLAIYLLKTYETLDSNLNNDSITLPITGVISVPFLYLAVTFAVSIFTSIADVITCNGKQPLAFQLYPARTLLTMLATASFVSFSFATVADFIKHDPYIDKSGKGDFALYFAAVSAIIFNMFPNQKLGFKIIELLARRFGSEDKKEMAHFGIEMREFLENMHDSVSRKKFGKSLSALREQDRIALMPVVGVEDNIDQMLSATLGKRQDDNFQGSLLHNMSNRTKGLLGIAAADAEPGQLRALLKKDPKARREAAYGGVDNPRPQILIEGPGPGFFTKIWNALPS